MFAASFVEDVAASEADARGSVKHVAATNHAEFIFGDARGVGRAFVLETAYTTGAISDFVISDMFSKNTPNHVEKKRAELPDVLADRAAACVTAGQTCSATLSRVLLAIFVGADNPRADFFDVTANFCIAKPATTLNKKKNTRWTNACDNLQLSPSSLRRHSSHVYPS